jgi:hypothetical protein
MKKSRIVGFRKKRTEQIVFSCDKTMQNQPPEANLDLIPVQDEAIMEVHMQIESNLELQSEPVQMQIESNLELQTKPVQMKIESNLELSWEFRDSSHGDGLSEGLDGVRRWVRLGIVPTETPRFTQVQGPPHRR